MRKLILILILSLFFNSCEDNPAQNLKNPDYVSDGKAALVMVVENSDLANQQMEEIAFSSYPNETRQIFSEVFGVAIDSLYNKDLNQILNQYGEPWQIAEIQKAGKGYYQKIIALTDEDATAYNLIEELELLRDEGYNIDLVFSLHGNTSIIKFVDASVPINSFTNTLKEKGIAIRVLYQTNCKSAKPLDNWINIGVAGCNGTIENNYLTIFAPINFVKSWVGGSSYYEAVQYAYNEEIATLRSFNDKLPLLDYITSSNFLSGSLPIISGRFPNITKTEYIKIKPRQL